MENHEPLGEQSLRLFTRSDCISSKFPTKVQTNGFQNPLISGFQTQHPNLDLGQVNMDILDVVRMLLTAYLILINQKLKLSFFHRSRGLGDVREFLFSVLQTQTERTD